MVMAQVEYPFRSPPFDRLDAARPFTMHAPARTADGLMLLPLRPPPPQAAKRSALATSRADWSRELTAPTGRGYHGGRGLRTNRRTTPGARRLPPMDAKTCRWRARGCERAR